MSSSLFLWYDYLIFFATLVGALGIAVYQSYKARNKKTTNEYLMGGRSLSPLPVAASIVMSTVSAILFLGNAAEMYQYGGQYIIRQVMVIIGWLVASALFVPLFYSLGVTSVFEVRRT